MTLEKQKGLHPVKIKTKPYGEETIPFQGTTLNTYRTAVSPTLNLLCHEDFSVG